MGVDVSHFKLKIDWKPSAYHGHTVRKALGNNGSSSLWRKIRVKVLEDCNNTCSICGFSPSDPSDLKQLHVHEIEEYGQDEDDLVVTLKGLNLICKKCHAFHHWGRTVSVTTDKQREELIQHFMKVNNCTREDFLIHYKDVQSNKMDSKTIKDVLNESRKKSTAELISSIRRQLQTTDRVVKFRIDCDIPYKQEAIEKLKDKGLYWED